MRVSLEGIAARGALAGIVAALLLAEITAGASEFFASCRGQRWDEASLRGAIRLEPDNASYWARLGEYQLWEQGRSREAIASLNSAVRLQPTNSAFLLTLAAAYRVAGDVAAESTVLEQALQADRTRPQVIWVVANSYLSRGSVARGLQLLWQYLAVTDEDPTVALDLAWRVAGNPETVLAQLPARPREYASFLRTLITRQDSAAAAIVWSRFARLHDVPVADVLPYINYLLLHGDAEGAERAWDELSAKNPSLRLYRDGDDAVTNGGFEQPVLNGGLDWTIYHWPGVQGAIETREVHSGGRSLVVEFSGDPVAEAGVHQYAVVQPGARYRVSAFLRADDVQTASGLRLCVIDVAHNDDIAHTEEELGSTAWREFATTFVAGPSTHLVQLRFDRHPIEPRISGRVWIDDVSMKRIAIADSVTGRN
jgi:tetratricopeptide (TPR) repeat protein